MKIEAGKWYKTRDGQKVYIIGTLPENGIEVMWVGSLDRKYLTWFHDGRYEPLCGLNSNDLISLWEEPSEVKLPEKITRYENLTAQQLNLTNIHGGELAIVYQKISALIDFCESLQARVKELEGK